MAIAFAVSWLLWSVYPERLEVSTDIVGYPIFADFNGRRWIVGYLLLVVALPLIALAAWAVLGRVPGLRGRAGQRAEAEAAPAEAAPAKPVAPPARPATRVAAALARLAVIGAIWALSLAVLIGPGDGWVLWLLVPLSLAYAALIALGARALAPGGVETWTAAVSRANAVSAAFLLLGVAAASLASEVLVEQTGERISYPFVAGWVAVLVAVLAAILIVRGVRAQDAPDWRSAERGVLLCLALPVAMFLLLAELPSALGPPDYFHDGERMTAMQLVREGAFPWRDIVSVHGVLEDTLWPLFGTSIFGNSRWGWVAGEQMITSQLFWVGTFLLCVYLFHRNWQFLAGIFCLIVLAWLPGLGTERLVLVPLTFLLLAAVLARPTWPRIAAFMAISLADPILVPETVLFSGSAWLVVLLYELAARPDGTPLAAALVRTVRCAAVGAALLIGFVIFLAAYGAADEFFGFFTEFIGGHDLTGALPIQWNATEHPELFKFWVFAPIVVILASWLYVAWRVRRRAAPTISEWVVLAATLPLIPYYTRFLSRADDHLYLFASAAFVPVCYFAYRLLEPLDERAAQTARWRLGRRPLATAALVAVVVFAPTAAITAVGDAPERYSVTVAQEPPLERMGYTRPDSLDQKLLADMRRVTDRHLPAGGSFFDFTNSPELFGYFLDLDLATRYYHVSTAIRESTQEDLISELEEEMPELIAFSSQRYGLPIWDQVSNPVRHYLVSDWLLDRYAPVAHVDGYVFMTLNDGAAPDADSNGLTSGRGCDWRYAPNFLETSHGPTGDSEQIALGDPAPTQAVTAYGWALDPSGHAPAEGVVLAVGDRVVKAVGTGIARPDVSAALGDPGVELAGFGVRDVELPAGTDPSTVRFYALAGDGSAAPLPPAPSAPLPRGLRLPGPGALEVSAEPAAGSVDALDVKDYTSYRVELPPEADTYDWFELTSAAPLGDTEFLISDRGRFVPSGAGDYLRTISFNSRAADETAALDVMVGACPQWHAWGGRELVLRTRGDARVTAITLRQ